LALVAGSAPVVLAEQGLSAGEVPLTAVQCWFFEQELVERQHFNQAVMLSLGGVVDQAVLAGAWERVVAHHDGLRLRFVCEEGCWRQFHGPLETAAGWSVEDLSGVAPGEQAAALEGLARGVLAGLGGSWRLLLVAHHLVVDAVSWRVLLEDLWSAYRDLVGGVEPALPAKTTSFGQWAARVGEHVAGGGLDDQVVFWSSLPEEAAPLPVDGVEGVNTVGSTDTVVVELGEAATGVLVQHVPGVYHTQIGDVLITALAQALAEWTGSGRVVVDAEGHGREALFDDVDLSRTVGWFTSVYPLWVDVPGGDDPGAALRSVKEQLRRIPERGVGYGLLRYLHPDPAVRNRVGAGPHPQVSFNYLGHVAGPDAQPTLWGPAPEATGPSRAPAQQRRYLLEINAAVTNSSLQLHWTYSRHRHHHNTIHTLAHRYLHHLHTLITHCQHPTAGGYTPSDFPLARVDQEGLDRLLARLGQPKER
jgi:non-ribosomal peptide synthase protein (TIGR01720 family)